MFFIDHLTVPHVVNLEPKSRHVNISLLLPNVYEMNSILKDIVVYYQSVDVPWIKNTSSLYKHVNNTNTPKQHLTDKINNSSVKNISPIKNIKAGVENNFHSFLYNGTNNAPVKHIPPVGSRKSGFERNFHYYKTMSVEEEEVAIMAMIIPDAFVRRKIPINHATFFQQQFQTILLMDLLPYKYYVLSIAYETRFSHGLNSSHFIFRTNEEGNYY